MEDTTLLTIFVGLVALAFVVIATVVAVIGWQVFKILEEFRSALGRMRRSGKEIAKEAHAVGKKIRSYFRRK